MSTIIRRGPLPSATGHLGHLACRRRYDPAAVQGVLRGARWDVAALRDSAALPSDDDLLAQAAGASSAKALL